MGAPDIYDLWKLTAEAGGKLRPSENSNFALYEKRAYELLFRKSCFLLILQLKQENSELFAVAVAPSRFFSKF